MGQRIQVDTCPSSCPNGDMWYHFVLRGSRTGQELMEGPAPRCYRGLAPRWSEVPEPHATREVAKPKQEVSPMKKVYIGMDAAVR